MSRGLRLQSENQLAAMSWRNRGARVETTATSKFGNVTTPRYDSKKEAARAAQLHMLQRAGQIRNLREQVEFEIIPKQDGERAAHYRADFVFEQLDKGEWTEIVEDSKGVRTAEYVLKRKLLLLVHGIRIVES